MKSFEQLARGAYAAFLKERKNQGSTGTNHLSWDGLTEPQKACWIAAAKQLWAEMSAIH